MYLPTLVSALLASAVLAAPRAAGLKVHKPDHYRPSTSNVSTVSELASSCVPAVTASIFVSVTATVTATVTKHHTEHGHVSLSSVLVGNQTASSIEKHTSVPSLLTHSHIALTTILTDMPVPLSHLPHHHPTFPPFANHTTVSSTIKEPFFFPPAPTGSHVLMPPSPTTSRHSLPHAPTLPPFGNVTTTTNTASSTALRTTVTASPTYFRPGQETGGVALCAGANFTDCLYEVHPLGFADLDCTRVNATLKSIQPDKGLKCWLFVNPFCRSGPDVNTHTVLEATYPGIEDVSHTHKGDFEGRIQGYQCERDE